MLSPLSLVSLSCAQSHRPQLAARRPSLPRCRPLAARHAHLPRRPSIPDSQYAIMFPQLHRYTASGSPAQHPTRHPPSVDLAASLGSCCCRTQSTIRRRWGTRRGVRGGGKAHHGEGCGSAGQVMSCMQQQARGTPYPVHGSLASWHEWHSAADGARTLLASAHCRWLVDSQRWLWRWLGWRWQR